MNRRWQLRVIFVISVTILAVSMVFTINAQAIEGGMVKEGSVQEGREPIQVGEIETTQFFFSYPVLLSGPQTIQYPDAAYIKIHIAELDLRRVIFINGTYYRLVSIDSYNPLNYEPTKVKLLQIDNINYDYTSNDVIYKTLEGGVKVLSENRNGLVITNKNENVQIN